MDSAQSNSTGDKYAEDLLAAGGGARMPDWVEEHFAREREWWRLVRSIKDA